MVTGCGRSYPSLRLKRPSSQTFESQNVGDLYYRRLPSSRFTTKISVYVNLNEVQDVGVCVRKMDTLELGHYVGESRGQGRKNDLPVLSEMSVPTNLSGHFSLFILRFVSPTCTAGSYSSLLLTTRPVIIPVFTEHHIPSKNRVPVYSKGNDNIVSGC